MILTWTIIVLGAILHGTQSDPTVPQSDLVTPSTKPTNPQDDPVTSPIKPTNPQNNPVTPPIETTNPITDPVTPSTKPDNLKTNPVTAPIEPTNPITDPVTPSTQPANPKTDPVTPPIQPTNPKTDPVTPQASTANPQTIPNDPLADPTAPQITPAAPQTSPTHPPNNSTNPQPNPVTTQTKPTNTLTNSSDPQTNPVDLRTSTAYPQTSTENPQTDPTKPQIGTSDLRTSPADPKTGSFATFASPHMDDDVPTTTMQNKSPVLDDMDETVKSNTVPKQDRSPVHVSKFFDLNSKTEEDILFKACKTLGQKIKGNCSVTLNINGTLLTTTVTINADQPIPEASYTPVKEQQEIPNKEIPDSRETIPDTLIAILASCGALVLILCFFAAYCTYHRRSYRKNQQHLTEELQTVENGYHDNPTLEVMEVQPEMQEKKPTLNGEFNDSWIVPIDNLLKEDIPDEEDTHL